MPDELENQFQQAVIECAHLLGWQVAHFRPARTKHGWRTAVGADGKGFPDLVMVRRERIVFAELKTKRGVLSDDQRRWQELLERAAPVEMFVWRPADWDQIQTVLR